MLRFGFDVGGHDKHHGRAGDGSDHGHSARDLRTVTDLDLGRSTIG
ncbi:MAG TPA: hypothetical protein VM282_02875 [Acidimicrobiales bacterium]|nr:hypothetical protein [Acidimicrobiales bacterium]